jgi:uncharacterized protein (TIGR04222 family)
MNDTIAWLLDLRGPTFLNWYAGLGLAFFVWGLLSRWLLRSGGDASFADHSHQSMTTFEKAYLAGGARRAVDSALTGLFSAGAVTCTGGRFQKSGNEGHTGSEGRDRYLERDILMSLDAGKSVGQIVRSVRQSLDPIRQACEDKGLVVTPGKALLIRFGSALPLVLLLALGAMKIQVGLSRDKPVSLLIVEMVLVLIGTLFLLALPTHRTRSGDRALAALQEKNSPVKFQSLTNSGSLTPLDMATAVGIFGIAALPAIGFAELASAIEPYPNRNATGSGSSSSCSSSTSSCSGGSSCGGSGCGGCGGGD